MAALQRLICISGLVLLAVGSAAAAAAAAEAAPPSLQEHDKKVVLGVRLTMKQNALRDCPQQPEATEALSKYVGETLLHLLETAGIKGKVKSGIIKCTRDAGDANDAESYGQRVRFTFAASIESKAASALHALLEQMQQLEHNGLSVCHVMGADCWRANVAKFELKEAQKVSKGVKLHKASKPYGDSSTAVGEEDGDAGSEHAPSHRGPKRHHKGGKKGVIHEKKHSKRDAMHEAKQHMFERKAAKWQHKREKHGHYAGSSSSSSSSDSAYSEHRQPQEQPAVVTLSSQQVNMPAPFAGRHALTSAMPAAARLAAPQFQLGSASTQMVYLLPQQPQLSQQPLQQQPAVAAAAAVAVPQAIEASAYTWASDPDVVITEEALMSGVSASNEQR